MYNLYYRPNDGKLEKSFISFQRAHPQWDGMEDGKSLMSRLEVRIQPLFIAYHSDTRTQQTYKTATEAINNEHMASMLEQTLHASTSLAGGLDFKHLTETGSLPSVLMSIMKEKDIDYHNDFYWLTKVLIFEMKFYVLLNIQFFMFKVSAKAAARSSTIRTIFTLDVSNEPRSWRVRQCGNQ